MIAGAGGEGFPEAAARRVRNRRSRKAAFCAALLLVVGLRFFAIAADPAPALPVEIPPGDPAIHYSGRFDMRDKTAPRCEWPACSIAIKFNGTDIGARFNDSGHNYWQVEIDGKPGAKLALQSGTNACAIAAGLAPGEHIVTLTKATEAFFGATQFLGFELNAGAKALPFPAVARRLEVVGDSISCGYGVEAANQNEHFTPQTENAYDAWGAVAARRLGADYACLAWSGRKMWPDNTMGEIYDRTLAGEASPKWDFSSWTPDAVVINLSTNDFGRSDPDEAQWTGAYRKFIARVRGNYPKAVIYCATGPMLGDSPARKPRTDAVNYVQKVVAAENAAGDANVRALDFGQQDPANGLGADWHPSRRTQQLMADKLVETLQRDLGWK